MPQAVDERVSQNYDSKILVLGHPLVIFLLNYFSSREACIIARTFRERPNRLMKPSASW